MPLLGSIILGTTITTTMPANNGNFSTISLTTPGTYIFFWAVQISYTTLPGNMYIGLTSGTIPSPGFPYGFTSTGVVNFANSLAFISQGGTYGLSIYYSGGSGLVVYTPSCFYAVRVG